MALETVEINVGPDAYTLIGQNVTSLTVTENKVGSLLIHIVATGGSAPTLASAGQVWDKAYEYSDGAADIYITSPDGSTTVGVVRK